MPDASRSTTPSVGAPRAPADLPDYRSDIDGLRGVAVLVVVGFHAFPNYVPGGYVGVDVFFVISGYLISKLILEAHARGSFSIADFYARRVRRILPALIVVLAACYGFAWFVLLQDEFASLGRHITGGAWFVSNFVLFHESGYFDSAAELKPLLHLWSLGIEEQFYLVWPLLLAAAWRFRANLLLIGSILAALSFIACQLSMLDDPSAAFYLPWARAWELLAGFAIAAVEFQRGSRTSVFASAPGWVQTTLSVAGLAMIVASIAVLTRKSEFPGFWALLPVAGAAVLIAGRQDALVNRRVLSNPLLVWVGLISFPLYLWHWPLLSFMQIVDGDHPSRSMRITAVVLAFILAWLTYRLVELPLRFGGQRAAKVGMLLGCLFVMGVLGLLAISRDGYPHRLDPHMRAPVVPVAQRCPQGYPEGAVCWGRSSPDIPRTLVIGDSHGVAFAPGLARLAEERRLNIQVVQLSRGGCMPLLAVKSFDARGVDRACEDFYGAAYQQAASDPSVDTVILVGRWATRVGAAVGFKEKEGSQARGSYQYSGGPTLVSDNSRALQLGLDHSIRMIPDRVSVVFLHQAPELGLDPRRCMDRPFSFRPLPGPDECDVSRSLVDERQAEYRHLIADVASLSRARVVDPLDVLCNPQTCAAFADGRLIYRDDDHLNVIGATTVAAQVVAALGASVSDRAGTSASAAPSAAR